MKKLSYVLAAVMLMFSFNAFADKSTKDMLDQVYVLSSSWHPIVGKSVYKVHKNNIDVAVLCLYDVNSLASDPEKDDIQVVFVKGKGGYKLVAAVFSSIDKVLANIELIMPQ